MASLLLFVIVRHSRVWLLRLLIHRSHQSKLPILSGMEWEKRLWSKCQVLKGFITRRKVAQSSSQLYGCSTIIASLFLCLIERH